MKRRFGSSVVFAVAVFLLSVASVSAQTWDCGAVPGTVSCVLDENGRFMVSGEGAMANYGWNSTPWYDLRNSITSLVIEEGVTRIGNNAFVSHSNLTGSLFIPNSVTSIGNFAFYGCSGFTGDLVIPSSVTNIGGSAFSDCSGFTGSLVIPNSVTSIGNGAFANCSGFTGSLVIGNSVTTIEGHAFSGCSGFTGDLIIPNSVTTIGQYAFRDCSGFTGSLTISNSVTSIGLGAFFGCSGFTGDLVIPNSVTTIGVQAFSGCSGLTSITIPNSVTTIETGAFSGCSGLTSITIPSSVINIGWHAFEGCTRLTSINVASDNSNFISINGVLFNKAQDTLIQYPPSKQESAYTIPTTVTTIGINAFLYCTGLTSVTIPNSVTTILGSAFANCTSLTSINVVSDNPNFGSVDGVLFNKAQDTLIQYPAGKQGAYTIPNSVTTIGGLAFSACIKLTSITIPNSVTTIGTHAFLGCIGLTSITIPNSVTTIRGTAFANCTSLTSINVASDNPNFGSVDGVLFNKAQDTLIQYPAGKQGAYTIPNSVTTIGIGAFHGCIGLSSITIPNSVSSVLIAGFSGCSGLRSILIQHTIPPINVSSRINTDAICLYVPENSISAYRAATGWGDFTCILDIASYATTSIAVSNRNIPPSKPDAGAAVVPPVNVSAFEVSVGPNPVRKIDGVVNIFVAGKRIDDGTLTVYDASGNVVGKVNVKDNHPAPLGHPAMAGNNVNINGNDGRRVVGAWDLRDAKGRMVPEGTYLLRGSVRTVDWNRERVSVVVGVR